MTASSPPIDQSRELVRSVSWAPTPRGLTDAQMAELLHALDEARVRAVATLASLDRNEMLQSEDRQNAARAMHRAQMRLAAIHDAYRRISEGTYNACGCGEPIGVERLTSIPETGRCVECARTDGFQTGLGRARS